MKFATSMKKPFIYSVVATLAVGAATAACGYVQAACGIVFGAAIGLVYFLLLLRRLQKAMQLPQLRAVMYMKTGWWLRLTFILAALAIASQFSCIDLWAVVVGLFAMHIIIIINAFFMALRNDENKFCRKEGS